MPKDLSTESDVSSLADVINTPVELFAYSSLTAGDRAPNTHHLDVLSAESYPYHLNQRFQPKPSQQIKRKEPSPLSREDSWYGGIVLNPSLIPSGQSASSAEREAEPARPKKKARKASKQDEHVEEESRKSRGRPRLDTQDETAADRRRTQIRLAQRAYRHRKETTISALKEQVAGLHSTIEQMNQIFLALHDNLMDAGVANSHYALGKQLQSAATDFEEMAKVIEFDEDEDDSGPQPAAKDKPSQAKLSPMEGPKDNRGSVQVTPTDSNSDDAEVEELPFVDNGTFGYMDAWGSPGQDVMQFNMHVPEPQIPLSDMLNKMPGLPLLPGYSSADMSGMKPSIERPLVSPSGAQGFYTYSFQETTFARRLHRMCLERAFRNLTNPTVDPKWINRAFRFTFCFSNRKRVVQRFKALLQRKAGESLENWNIPFFNIGGAGTHFPNTDDDGMPIFPPNMLPPDQAFCQEDIRPMPFYNPETPRDEKQVQELLESIGFGGVWLDSHDVEEYLKTKGIYLDGSSTFVEVDPTLVLPTLPASIPSTASTGSSSSNHTPLRTPSPLNFQSDLITDPDMQSYFSTASVTQPKHPNAALSQVQSSQIWPWSANGTNNDLFSTHSPPSYDYYFSNINQGSRSVTFDIEKFLGRMVDGAACLGRAPGFRRELIDNALVVSMGEAF